MQTYLIVANQPSGFLEEISKIKSKLNLSSYNIHEIIPSPSIGIPEARKIKEILSKKTFMGGDRLIIVKEIEKATVQAANALLKLLEEPPARTFFVLTTSNVNRLLPTIVSRCQILNHDATCRLPDAKTVEKTEEILKQIITSLPGKRLIISQGIAKTKELTIQFLDDLTVTLSYLLNHQNAGLDLSVKEIAQLLNKTASAKLYLEKNVNFKAVLDILLLGFPKIKIADKSP